MIRNLSGVQLQKVMTKSLVRLREDGVKHANGLWMANRRAGDEVLCVVVMVL